MLVFLYKNYGPSNDISKSMVSKRTMVGDTWNSLMENAVVARTLQGFKGSLNKYSHTDSVGIIKKTY